MNPKQRQARLTGSEVQEAIRHWQEQGVDNPSIRRIYHALGQRGSFSKIIELKKQVFSQPLSNGDPTVTPKDNIVIPIDNKISNSAAALDNMRANISPPSVINLEHLEKPLWERIETRLKEWEEKLKSPEPDPVSQVSELETALSEMRDLWLEAITQCNQLEAQVQELTSQLEAKTTEHQASNEKYLTW